MSEDLADLLAHDEWADALHWRAIERCPAALSDAALGARLRHICVVERAFLSVLSGEPLEPALELENEPSLDALKAEARRTHARMRELLAGADADALRREVTLPWFRDPPCRITLAEALRQVAMHSHYHRGQNATRLRELGGEPPLTDLIVWYWKGRSAPEW